VIPGSFESLGMGVRRHGQEGALATPPPSENVLKYFCALVVAAKHPVNKLFMHYFHNLSAASENFAHKIPKSLHPWTRLGILVPRPLICPPWKKSCGCP